MPTQLANGERHADRRGWRVVARFKDDGYSAFKEIKRDDFVNLIEMIERDDCSTNCASGTRSHLADGNVASSLAGMELATLPS